MRGQVQKIVGAARPAELSELRHRNEMVALNASGDDYRAYVRLFRLLPQGRDQIYN
jgi:hypothetical protein